jgi:hypothetical protein
MGDPAFEVLKFHYYQSICFTCRVSSFKISLIEIATSTLDVYATPLGNLSIYGHGSDINRFFIDLNIS